MNEPIEEAYFNWLYSRVASTECPTPSTTYYNLFQILHGTEFVWVVNMDENRAADGLELRKEFHRIIEIHYDEEIPWIYVGCSVLEMLIAFSIRAQFQTDASEREWFWAILHNLELDELSDAHGNIQFRVEPIIERLIWRTYSPNGVGGMFPLKVTEKDQRKVEIWYQFFEYLEDQNR